MSWRRRKVSDLCVLVADCPHSTPRWTDEGVRVLRSKNIRNGTLDLDAQISFTSEHEYEKRTRRAVPQCGDLVITREAPMGEVCMLADIKCCLGQRMVLLRPDESEVDPCFLLYAFQSHAVQGQIKMSEGTGTTVSNLRIPHLEAIDIPFPSLKEQQNIAVVLKSYDDLVENNRRRIQLLEESARLLYKEWFVHLRFPGHEHTKITNGLPAGWERKPLAELCSTVKSTVSPENLPPETPYIGLEHIPRRSLPLSSWGHARDVDSTKYRFERGDILFGKIRPYFHKVGFAMVNGITSSDAIVIRPIDALTYHYVLCLLASDNFVALASQTVREGSKMPRADWKHLLGTEFLLPPNHLLELFSNALQPTCQQICKLVFEIRKLAQARDLLLPRLMSGEIVV